MPRDPRQLQLRTHIIAVALLRTRDAPIWHLESDDTATSDDGHRACITHQVRDGLAHEPRSTTRTSVDGGALPVELCGVHGGQLKLS
jgi:hypothetical protein